MRPGGGGTSRDPRLVDAYEAMRQRRGWGGPGAAGYELVRRQGLAAWIQAFSACVGAPAPDPRPGLTPVPRASARPDDAGASSWVPLSLYPEVTRLLAGLALGPLLGPLQEGLR